MVEHENENELTGNRKRTNSKGYMLKNTVYGKLKRKHTDPYDTQSSNKSDMST